MLIKIWDIFTDMVQALDLVLELLKLEYRKNEK
jgi:hypothetical protein